MFRQNGIIFFSANSAQTLSPDYQVVVYTGNGTGTYAYTLAQTATAGVFGMQAFTGRRIIIRHAGTGSSIIRVTKNASDTGIYLSASGAVTSFDITSGQAVELVSDGIGNWYMVDGTNFFDTWDDLEMLTSARAALNTSAVLSNIGNGVESWRFQPSTLGGTPDKWLMGQRQITHGWDKNAIQWHVHFTPVSDLVATGTGIVVTWTMVWRTVSPVSAVAWTNESNLTMTYSLASGTLSTANNYNASTGGNNGATTLTTAFPSTMVLARLELTSVTNNGANQSTEMLLNGWDAHIKLRKRGTVNAFPEP
jgi:hypothetical protein